VREWKEGEGGTVLDEFVCCDGVKAV